MTREPARAKVTLDQSLELEYTVRFKRKLTIELDGEIIGLSDMSHEEQQLNLRALACTQAFRDIKALDAGRSSDPTPETALPLAPEKPK